MSRIVLNAKEHHLAGCHICGQVVDMTNCETSICPRCNSLVYFRKPNSIKRAWAFLIAAFIMYIPANTERLMYTNSFGKESSDTILSGVLYFLEHGDWHLAIVIFVASVMLPLLKMVTLAYILISVQRGVSNRKSEKMRLYRYAEFLGKWSMLDIFVVGLMATLVQLGSLTKIVPGPACLAFGSVVVLTMFAEMAFDPKLIWDQMCDK